jgi:hypothetical protein
MEKIEGKLVDGLTYWTISFPTISFCGDSRGAPIPKRTRLVSPEVACSSLGAYAINDKKGLRIIRSPLFFA